MNVKLPVDQVKLLIDKNVFNSRFCKQIATLGAQADLLFPEPQIGAGYLQWHLSGEGWRTFAACGEDEKSVVAREYRRRRDAMKAVLKNSPIMDSILTIPTNEYIYFKENDGRTEIALAAWGYRFHNTAGTGELISYTTVETVQSVRIGFMWDKQLLSFLNFSLNNQPRQTFEDGLFYAEDVPVGKTYPIELSSGDVFSLTVEQNRADYIYDITRYFTACVRITRDGSAGNGKKCSIAFNGNVYDLVTDANGEALMRLPFVNDLSGSVADEQPECIAECDSECLKKRPAADEDQLLFEFGSVEDVPAEPKPELAVGSKPAPAPEEPQFVYIRLKDYDGFPLADIDFVLTTKTKGQVSLKTNYEGECVVLREWFSDKEKINVSFTVTPEYQKTHDIHRTKSQKR